MKTAHFKLAGHFSLVAIKPDGSQRVLADFPNLILDGGLNRLGTANPFGYCRVGTGNTAPSAGQSDLITPLASTNDQTVTLGYDSVGNAYTWMRQKYRFAAGVAEGVLAEVGVGWASSGSTLFSRALIVDGEGDPTTVTVLEDEILDVTYELRNYLPADATFTLNISGDDYDCTLRPSDIDEQTTRTLNNFINVANNGFIFSGTIGTVTQLPSGTSINTVGKVTVDPAYSNNSQEQCFKMVIPVDDVISGGIRSAVLSTTWGSWQCQFDPAIPKTDSQALTLNWIVSWGRTV